VPQLLNDIIAADLILVGLSGLFSRMMGGTGMIRQLFLSRHVKL
tara:strand:- start:40195 stop:40326 length:132 start_codon:yes stop_codon:yes gene_type:complete